MTNFAYHEALHGVEHDWLAVDQDGHVGFFTTAGGGLAPRALVLDPHGYEAAIAALFALPAAGEPTTDDWTAMARRGVYTFDADYNGGPYRPGVAPEVPALVAALPQAVAEVARRVALNTSFRSATELSLARLNDWSK